MSKQVWMCEKCGRLCDDEKSATECESRHKPIVSVEALSWCSGDFQDPFPKRIKVKIDVKWMFDYAIYEIVQVGPKGC